MPQTLTNKKSNRLGIVVIILFIAIILGAGGLFWLHKIENTQSDNYKKQANNTLQVESNTQVSSSNKSWATEFYERLVNLYGGANTGNTKNDSAKNKSKNGATTNTSSTTSKPSTNTDTGALDTDVPWREEGEPDLDYSYQEVRECGAAIKGPPEISDNQEQFEAEYHEYLAWIDQDCRDAYAEAGKPYPF